MAAKKSKSIAVRSILIILVCLLLPSVAQTDWDVMPDTWVATDELGRILPDQQAAGPVRPDRYIGIFYFIWHDVTDIAPIIISDVLEKKPDALNYPDDPLWGPFGSFHFWGKSLYDHYRTSDPYVLCRHAYLLVNAGVDMLLFDASNGHNYESSVRALIAEFLAIKKHGQRVPQLAFHCRPDTGTSQRAQIAALYNNLYKNPEFRDVWFLWKGKPLIVAIPEPALGKEILDFFTFRKPYWLGKNPGPDSWTLDSWFPVGGATHVMKNSSGETEQIGVLTSSSITGGPMSSQPAGAGRSWRGMTQGGYRETAPGAVNHGYMYQDNWDKVRSVDPKFVLNYSWNEWTVQKYLDGTKCMFVDQFNHEFSKDIEPMSGGHGDNYYMQMVSNNRRFKGVRKLQAVVPYQIIIDGDFADWTNVKPEFRDWKGDPTKRDFLQYGNKNNRIVNSTGRNDIVASKVSYSISHLFFNARVAGLLTEPTASDSSWMILLVNSDGKASTGWMGYDFVVNRFRTADNSARIEKWAGPGYKWTPVGDAVIKKNDAQLELSVPRSVLGQALSTIVDFKWADNIKQTGTWNDFYLNGDVAPDDRFAYRARMDSIGSVAIIPHNTCVVPAAQNIRTYYNRHRDNITVYSDASKLTIAIYSLQGVLQKKYRITESEFTLSCNDLQRGCFIYTIQANGRMIIRSLIKY